MKYTDYAKRDEIKANLIAEQINQQVDSEMDIKKRIKQQRLVEASMNNHYKLLQAHKTKLENLRSEEEYHPLKTNEIYELVEHKLKKFAQEITREAPFLLFKSSHQFI